MPELPEVRTTAKFINKDVKNKTIIDVVVNVEKLIHEISVKEFKSKLINKKIESVTNVAKFLVFNFIDGTVMLSHMRMEGKYRFQKDNNFKKHDHVIFKFKDGYLIYSDTRKFGTFHIRNKDNYLKLDPIKKLGPLPSEKETDRVFKILQRKSIAIKSALLDQSIICGLGNIYVDEVLWASKINPFTKSKDISKSQVKTILKHAKEIMDEATKNNGSSISTYLAYNNIMGSYQEKLKVHTKVGSMCFRCKTKIIKTKVGGRGTYICPSCQNK